LHGVPAAVVLAAGCRPLCTQKNACNPVCALPKIKA
jgi:hypothetical protein